MTELEMKIEAEAPEFTDELSDEALDREGDYSGHHYYYCASGIVAER